MPSGGVEIQFYSFFNLGRRFGGGGATKLVYELKHGLTEIRSEDFI